MSAAGRRGRQLWGQLEQVVLHRKLFDPLQVAADVVRFPVDRYVRVGRSSQPLSLSLVIRTECNVRCVMCHSMDIVESGAPALTLDQIRVLLDHLGTRRPPNLWLTGGEPFVRKDLLDVIALVKARGVKCGVVTNGTLLPRETLERLVALELDCLQLSIHGDREAHDRITKSQGSFDRAVKAGRALCGMRGRPTVVVNAAVTEHNADRLEAIVDVAAEMGADAVRFEHLNFVTPAEVERMDDIPRRLGDPAATFAADVREPPRVDLAGAVQRLAGHRSRIMTFVKPSLDAREMAAWYSDSGVQGRHCTFPWRSATIDANGDVFPCHFVRFKVGNLLEEPLSAIWNGPRMQRFRREVDERLFPVCARCCKL